MLILSYCETVTVLPTLLFAKNQKSKFTKFLNWTEFQFDNCLSFQFQASTKKTVTALKMNY